MVKPKLHGVDMKKIIRFTASWCQPCKALSMTLDKMDLPFPMEVIDIDEQIDVAVEFGIRSVPTLVIVEEGNTIKRLIGLRTLDEIKEWLND